jgi:hypothetical protein
MHSMQNEFYWLIFDSVCSWALTSLSFLFSESFVTCVLSYVLCLLPSVFQQQDSMDEQEKKTFVEFLESSFSNLDEFKAQPLDKRTEIVAVVFFLLHVMSI